jgi:hypothetical protein
VDVALDWLKSNELKMVKKVEEDKEECLGRVKMIGSEQERERERKARRSFENGSELSNSGRGRMRDRRRSGCVDVRTIEVVDKRRRARFGGGSESDVVGVQRRKRAESAIVSRKKMVESVTAEVAACVRREKVVSTRLKGERGEGTTEEGDLALYCAKKIEEKPRF